MALDTLRLLLMDSHPLHLPIAVSVAVLCVSVTIFIYPYCRARPLPGIPHDPYHWFFGHLKDVSEARQSGLGFMLLCSQYAFRNGPVCQVLLGPFKNLILLSDPQEVDVSRSLSLCMASCS